MLTDGFAKNLNFMQSGLAEVSKIGPYRSYVADPWSQIGCTSLCSKVNYTRFGTRGLLRKYETARFSTPQLDQIGQNKTWQNIFVRLADLVVQFKHQRNKKLALNSELQTYQILTNDDQMLNLCLSYFIATV